MKAFREERNTMHTKRAARWVSSIAVLSATALGLGAPLAVPASATGTETITAVPEQPRYPSPSTATFDVTVTNPTPGDQLGLSVVSGPDAANPNSSCTTISTSGTATCHLVNTSGPGTDTVTVSDPATGAVSPQTQVTFETLTATANQTVNTSGGPIYLYGAGETATINATFAGGGTPQLKGLVTSGPDNGNLISCTQSTTQPANWSCALPNGGTPGVDTVQLFDDDAPNGTTNQADSSEAKTSLTIYFEGLQATPVLPRVNTSPAGTAAFNVTLTGKPAGYAANIKEVITSGQYSSVGGCTPNPASTTDTSFQCKIVNNGRADTVTATIFDDLNGNGSPNSTEPQDSATANFEVLSAQDANPGSHPSGSTATINVTVSGTPAGQTPSIDMLVTSGPDTSATPVICPSSGTNTFTCSLRNSSGSTTPDAVTIFDDANNNGALDPGEPRTTIDITFGSNQLTATPRAADFPTTDSKNAGSGIAPIDVTVPAGTQNPNIRYTVVSGPDKDTAAVPSHPCDSTGDPTQFVCNVQNSSATAGPDAVQVFNDVNNNQTFDSPAPPATGDPFAPQVTVNFVNPDSITLTPKLAPGQGSAQIATGGCQPYTVDVTPGVKFPVRITATEDLGSSTSAPPAALSVCNVPGGTPVTPSNPSTNPSGGGALPILAGHWTDTLFIDGSTGADPAHPGEIVFGIASSTAGTVTLSAATTLASHPNKATPSQTLTVKAPGTPHSVTVSPASQSIVANGSAPFTILVQDSTATPVPGASVSYFVAAGDPDATSSAVACAKTDQLGQSKCSVVNNGKVGTDHVIFFAPLTAGETAPAANDPQAPATVAVHAVPPAGSSLTFGCPDELASDANQIVPSCTVSTGNGSQRQVIFAAHVADASNAPLANLPVTFTLVNAPAGATASASPVNTNAKGNALYIVTVPSPASGNKITVQAAVGDPANGGLGPDTAVATFQAPHPAAVSVSPRSQKVSAGGLVSVTGRVLDQFGVGVAGQQLDFAVTGRNSTSGQVTTGSAGTASINYPDTGGSGSTDTISVLDVSPNAPSGTGANNPATATVSYGSTGCTSNCNPGGGTGQREAPSLTVRQHSVNSHTSKLKLTVTSHPRLVNATVIFYQVSKSGARHRIGKGTTGPRGTVSGTLRAAKGLHLRFQAKVKGRAGVASGYTRVVKVHVH